MKKIKLDISGMHCKSCELILEKSLKNVKNVSGVNANEKSWTLEIKYEWDEPDYNEVKNIIEEVWYKLGKKWELPWFNSDTSVYVNFVITLVSLFAIYLIISASWFDLSGLWNFSKPTFSVALAIWFTAWISSCMALVGWLVLWVSAKWSEDHSNLSRYSKFEPHIYFNLWRILGFAFLWWILGLFGQIFSLSPFLIWILMLATWLVMLILGINLSEISPKISSFTLTLPKSLWKNVGKNNWWSKHIFALTTGALTFFLPCGFTLAMQAYAITTGNFIDGALIMMAFAIGTAPGLLWVGWLSSIFSWENAKKIFKVMWVLVILLSVFNIANWYTLIKLGWPNKINNQIEANPWEIQEIRMTQDNSGYTPSILHVKPSTKIKWIINATNPYSCSIQFIVPSIWVNKTLEKWENIIEFVSPENGEIKFSCAMWMYSGKIIIDSNESSFNTNIINSASAESWQDNSSVWQCAIWWKEGSSGWCGGSNSNSTTERTWGWCAMMWGGNPTPTTTTSSEKTNQTSDNWIETINLTYTTAWLSSNVSAKKWKSYKIVIDVKDTIWWCMSAITIPWLDDNSYNLIWGTKITFNITPTESGRFPLTCDMWVPHWYIIVE